MSKNSDANRVEKRSLSKKLLVLLGAPLMALLPWVATAKAQSTNPSVQPPKAFSVQLDQGQMDVITRALGMAASQCETQIDGCYVGINRQGIMNSFTAAKKTLDKPPVK